MRGLYVITKATERSATKLYDDTSEALLGGASWVQFRHKTHDQALRVELGNAVFEACRKYDSKFIVNDSVDLALTLHADGVHLGQTDGSLIEARCKLGPQALLGRTCHNSVDLMNKAVDEGASYCAFGRLFHSTTKPNSPGLSLQQFKAIVPFCPIPAVVIGGITVENAAQAIDAGADIIAVSSAIFDAANIGDVAHQFTRLF